MRDFFIRSFEFLVGVIVVVMSAVVIIAAIAAMSGAGMGPMSPFGQSGNILVGLAILVGGALYIIFVGGIMYLGVGIYQNTRRTAEAVERMRNG